MRLCLRPAITDARAVFRVRAQQATALILSAAASTRYLLDALDNPAKPHTHVGAYCIRPLQRPTRPTGTHERGGTTVLICAVANLIDRHEQTLRGLASCNRQTRPIGTYRRVRGSGRAYAIRPCSVAGCRSGRCMHAGEQSPRPDTADRSRASVTFPVIRRPEGTRQ